MKGLHDVMESLKNVENIIKAEQKRRVESNEIMNDYIVNYLDQLQASINGRVNAQFHSLKHQIENIDFMLTKAENELAYQETHMHAMLEERRK